MNGEVEFDNFLQFTRYLRRTSLIRELSDSEMDLVEEGIFPNEMFILFFALLYVVIEVFKELLFDDNVITFLISDKYQEQVDILRRMRNSVFHPDKSVYSERQVKLLYDSSTIVPWAYTLYDEFERYLFFYPERHSIYGRKADDLRLEIKKIHNWLPMRSMQIRKKNAWMKSECI